MEHDVSIITGRQVLNNIDTTKYNVIPIYIDKNNKWMTGDDLHLQQTYLPFVEKKHKKHYDFGWRNIFAINNGLKQKRVEMTVRSIVVMARSEEDGNLQGLLNILSIPSTGSDTHCKQYLYE